VNGCVFNFRHFFCFFFFSSSSSPSPPKPCPPEHLAKLAAYNCHYLYGPFNPAVHTSGYVLDHILELLPAESFSQGRKRPLKWESEILKFYRLLADRRTNPIEEYLDLVEKLPFYGTTFFEVNVEDFDHLHTLLGVDREGISLLNDDGLERLEMFRWTGLQSWGMDTQELKADGFCPCRFYLEVEGPSMDSTTSRRYFDAESPQLGIAIIACITKMAIACAAENPVASGHAQRVEENHDTEDEEDESEEDESEEPRRNQQTIEQGLGAQRRAAATRLQAVTRGFLFRNRFSREIEQPRSAIFIQHHVRRYLERKRDGQEPSSASSRSLASLDDQPPPGMLLSKPRTSTSGTLDPLVIAPPGVPPPGVPLVKTAPPPLNPPPGLSNPNPFPLPLPKVDRPRLPDSTEHIILPPPRDSLEIRPVPPPPPPAVPPPNAPNRNVFKAPKPPPSDPFVPRPPLSIQTGKPPARSFEDGSTDGEVESIPSPPDSPPPGPGKTHFHPPTPPSTPPPLGLSTSDEEDDNSTEGDNDDETDSEDEAV